MADFENETTGEGAVGTGAEKVQGIAEQVLADVQTGLVEEDVSALLQQRLDDAGLEVRPEQVDDLAERIEGDASR
ncbi:MAG: hypothetical protein JWR33_1312 [Naasia sp.]|jgi:hypothetical protein|uniref:hypothetical protein n=1 Tax=Naasia sp. TaxID=2546198 RepID=UPI0026352DB6|nr:hypothetical protein [Naasia sp.]MCU1570571.1 hypothetical protein [Naasia sp.]